MVCIRIKQRATIPLLGILLILAVYGSNVVESKGIFGSGIHDCFRTGTVFAEALEIALKVEKLFKIEKPTFLMRSRKMNERKDLSKYDLSNLQSFDFDIKRKTYFITHGYIMSSKDGWMSRTEVALLKMEDANVITVDWSQKLLGWNYLRSVGITDNVGKHIAQLVQDLSAAAEKQGIPKESFGPLHIIGHSLGAHICGFASRELMNRQAPWQVHRITGLDPAKPCFDKKVEDDMKLDRADAPFVDIIHSNGDHFLNGGLGLIEPIGHFDFYVNQGKQQPGCTEVNIPVIDVKARTEPVYKAICSHLKVLNYFATTIENFVAKGCKFMGEPWDRSKETAEKIQNASSCSANNACVEMGINSESFFKGNITSFFVPVNENIPYCVEPK